MIHNENNIKANVEYGVIKNVYLTIPEDRPWMLCLFIDIESEKGGSFQYLLSGVNLNNQTDDDRKHLVDNIIKLFKTYNVTNPEDLKGRKIICLVDGMIIKGVELVGDNNDGRTV